MAQGSRIRENPALVPDYVNRFVALSHDKATVIITMGSVSELPLRMGDNTMGERMVVPAKPLAMPYEVAAELYEKLGQFFAIIQAAKGSVPAN